MKKILKVTLVIMLILSTIVLIPKTEEADSSSGSTVIYKRDGENWDNGAGNPIKWDGENFKWIENSKQKDSLSFSGSDMFANGNIFCLSLAQSTASGQSYGIQKEFIFDGNKITKRIKGNDGKITKTETTDAECIKFAKGLAYILAYNSSYNRAPVFNKAPDSTTDGWFSNVGYLPGNDPKQLALWAYLNDYVGITAVTNFFEGMIYSLPTSTTGARLIIEKDSGGNIVSFKHSNTSEITFTKSEEAVEIYNTAKDFNGTGNFTIYHLYNKNHQDLLLTEISKSVDSVDVTLSFKKQDFNGRDLSGATISLKAGDNVSSLTANSLGLGTGSVTVIPKSNTGKFEIKVTETGVPANYVGMSGEATLTVTYDTTTGTVTGISSNNGNIGIATNKTVIVKNKPKANLIINKTDSLTGIKLKDANFRVTLTNVASIEGYSGSPSLIDVTTDSNGQIKLTGIVPSDTTKSITATITETKAPTATGHHYGVAAPVTVTMTYSNGAWTASGASISGNTASVGIQNVPLINLSGNVWQDGQIGEKDVAGPNGLKDNGEKNLEGVIVELYSMRDKNVIKTTTTDSNGNYNFTNVSKTSEGYKIRFKYNGIHYYTTSTAAGVSKGTEVSRTQFNNRFKTIGVGQSNDGTALTYTYANQKSTLNATIAGHTIGTTDAKFQMSAETPVYTGTTEGISCGLVKKEFDLALGTDVKEATLKVNDKEVTYGYAQIMNGGLADKELDEILQNKSATDVYYNLYLYSSDFNYRISDYKTGDESINNNLNSSDNEVNNYDDLKELEVYITYSVILKNQTTYNATVDEFVYYYDAVYTPMFKVGDKVGDKVNEYEVISIENNKITFKNVSGNELSESNNYRKEIELTFRVNKDANSNVILKDNATNIAEITKYSTQQGGLIDKDSAPGNGITNNSISNYEDDTDQAKGINISLKQDKIRTITGTVFDDKDKDGSLNNENTPVNDVIVQLIEIKKIGGQYYEYIWQETRSGNNQVKTTARNGYEGTAYTNSVQAGSGQYEFKDFIPGNYIIRFIYGDGRTYDVTENVKTYNGQDYKSTVDKKYKAQWYNTAGYTAGQSVARDNEARRLEVMAYSSTVDKVNGEALATKNEDALKATWMCAETSRINIPVDNGNSDNIVTFENVNFGLTLRPQTKLVLEKHITGLKITPNGVGVQSIIDATKDIEAYYDENTDNDAPTGITTGLATIASDRNNRGFWKVETDIEELAQGAQLEVEYTYVIKNDGEKDYLSSNLIENYINDNVNYTEYLNGKAGEVKTNTKGNTQLYGGYLGQYYYTGNVGTSDAEVLSRVETIEEALNNQVKYDEEISGADFAKVNTENASEKVYNSDGTLVDRSIETVIKNTSASKALAANQADYTKTLKLATVLSASTNGELGANIPSYIAEVTSYSNAAGRRNMEAEPENLSYVHSEDTRKTMENSNEEDEFWGEQIIISKPTGEDKLTTLQIALIAIASVAVIGAGIVLIKKFVLKK